MKAIAMGAAATLLWAGAAIAQTTTPGTGAGTAGGATGMAPAARTTPSDATTTARDRATASGDSNQAVATTDANAPTPAKGANSFTEAQARSRLESNGFSSVSNLMKDEDGIWRGQASKNGRQSQVWLDYKGNVGQN